MLKDQMWQFQAPIAVWCMLFALLFAIRTLGTHAHVYNGSGMPMLVAIGIRQQCK